MYIAQVKMTRKLYGVYLNFSKNNEINDALENKVMIKE